MSAQQNQDQSQTTGQQTKKKRLIDKVCALKILEILPESQTYYDMFNFERKLESSITKQTLDIMEALRRPQVRIKKSLRIFISNLFYTHQDTGAPSWELKIEGRLMEENSRFQKRKFSSFFKSLLIELDSAIYGPENHLIEWIRTPSTSETDGFQVRRAGDLPVDCKILFQLDHQPRHYKIDKRLARLLGKRTDTRPGFLAALWQYIMKKSLQDSKDREIINNDRYLKQIFECKKMKFSEIPKKLNCLLSPPDPIVINHSIIRGTGETQRTIYDIDVEVEDNVRTDTMSTYFMSNVKIQELQQLEEKICDTLEAIKLTRNTFDLLTSFAENPRQFTNRWLASHSIDLKPDVDQPGDSEEERRAEYYYQSWLQEAVCRYFYRKIQERRGDLELL